MNSLATDQLYIKPYAGMYTDFFLVRKKKPGLVRALLHQNASTI